MLFPLLWGFPTFGNCAVMMFDQILVDSCWCIFRSQFRVKWQKNLSLALRIQVCPREGITLQETNISHKNGILKMIFLFPRWDMLITWRVLITPQILLFLDGIGTLFILFDPGGKPGFFGLS